MIRSLRIFFIALLLHVADYVISQETKCHKPCIPLSQCFTAQNLLKENGTRPTICYFLGFELFVCCPPFNPILVFDRSTIRVSQRKCEQFYPSKIPEGAFGAVAGYETEPNEFPFMAAIGYGDAKNPIYNCGGVLAERNYVITAAHCAKYNGEPAIVVRIGGNPLSDNATQPIRVVKVIIHPNYESNTELNDIAILALGQHVDETPVCLYSFGKLELAYQSNVIAMGYGSTSFGGAFARRLLKVYLKIIDNSECVKEYGNQPIVESQLCVQGNTRHFNGTEIAIQDTCQGDSGGPLLLQSSLTFSPRIVGIVSYGQGCGTKIPGIYTNISSYIDWIESVIWPGNNEDEKFLIS
ncbi:serine protease snake-like [Condylostylus longicornis]|uniref:serine protease snake-like n=1 Tax=Condylostylus longicornis TaxID=2530218 RepID=UPI00244E18AB|nr:serine protease snake-like [Condylostylus longicornis]